MYKNFKYITLGLFFVSVTATLLVHLFSKDFAGKLTQEDNGKLIAKGEKLYAERSCKTCHGDGGNKPINEDYPLLAGQPSKVL
jgi:cytochrome c553